MSTEQYRQVPHGNKELTCPMHKLPMSEVCHKCPLWTQIRGKSPQSEDVIDRWDCAFAWLPMLLVENSQRTHQVAAAVESSRNADAEGRERVFALALAGVGRPMPKLISAKPHLGDN